MSIYEEPISTAIVLSNRIKKTVYVSAHFLTISVLQPSPGICHWCIEPGKPVVGHVGGPNITTYNYSLVTPIGGY